MLEGCSVFDAYEVIFSSELSILCGLEVLLRCPLNSDADNMFDRLVHRILVVVKVEKRSSRVTQRHATTRHTISIIVSHWREFFFVNYQMRQQPTALCCSRGNLENCHLLALLRATAMFPKKASTLARLLKIDSMLVARAS